MSKSNELIDRYVYDVTRRLPQAQRTDIEKELRTLIDDMLAGKEDVKDVTLVLIELGRPAELAAKYRGSLRYLISPQLFGTYEMLLKIVLAAVAFGMLAANVIMNITAPPESVLLAVAQALGMTVMALFLAFGIITLIFAIVERTGKGEAWKKENDWHPRDLPEVPLRSAVIKKGDPIVSLVFSAVFLVIFLTMPWLFGVGIGLPAPWIPVFNLNALAGVIWLFVLLIAAGVAKDALRLIIGRYTIKLAAFVAALNIISFVLVVLVFGNAAVWNASFLADLQAATGAEWFGSDLAKAIWAFVPTLIVVLSGIGLAADTGTTLYRGIRYGRKSAAGQG